MPRPGPAVNRTHVTAEAGPGSGSGSIFFNMLNFFHPDPRHRGIWYLTTSGEVLLPVGWPDA